MESKLKTTKISATSRISLKHKDTYYTFEYSEERIVPEGIEINLEDERQILWNECHSEVDRQTEEIKNLI